jgi:AcrR family transcriptional regulator
MTSDPILTAARDVLMTHGPRRATLAEVARVAQVSRMTVYRRFDSLDRLLAEVLTAELAEVLAAGAAAATVGNARERCAATIAATTHAAASNPVLQQILAVDPESLTPLMVSRFGRTQRAAADMLQPLLQAGMSRHGGDGSIRDTDATALAQAVVLCAQGWVFAARAIGDHPSGELIWQQWFAIAAGMLRPTTGGNHD